MKKITSTDIAKKLGVTPITISRALNDRDGVSEDMKIKILETAREMGYTKVSKADKTNFNVLLLVYDVFLKTSNNMYIDLYKGILNELERCNSIATLKILEEHEVNDLHMPTILNNGTWSGIIILGELSTRFLKKLETLNIPILLLDFYDDNLDFDAIVSDNFFGAYQLTNYLINFGHKNIGFIGTINATNSIEDRYLGYRKALLRHKIPHNPNYVIKDRNRNGEYIPLNLPDRENMPSAFVCNCDEISYILIEDLKLMGLSVPRDCSIVTFDQTNYSSMIETKLTTIREDYESMIYSAVKILCKKMRAPNQKFGLTSIKGELIIGESVKKI